MFHTQRKLLSDPYFILVKKLTPFFMRAIVEL